MRGIAIASVASRAGWDLGDWALVGMTRHSVAVERAAAEIGVEARTLWMVAAAARRWPPPKRMPDLTIWHYHEAAPLPPDAADRLLAEAAAGGWSIQRLRDAVHAERKPARGQLSLFLELAPTGDSWRRDARYIERSARRRIRKAGIELDAALDEIGRLTDHPGRVKAHGNAVAGAIRRLGNLAPALGDDVARGRLRALLDQIAAGAADTAPAGDPSAAQDPAADPGADTSATRQPAKEKAS